MTNTTYCAADDLLLGDLTVGPNIDKQRYVEMGAEEIDACLYKTYVVPFDLSLLSHGEKLYLKNVNVLIATGLLLMALGNQQDVNMWGKSLLDDGRARLYALHTGATSLDNAPKTTSPVVTAPATVNYDATSGVDAFYDNVMRNDPIAYPVPTPWWKPGAA